MFLIMHFLFIKNAYALNAKEWYNKFVITVMVKLVDTQA